MQPGFIWSQLSAPQNHLAWAACSTTIVQIVGRLDASQLIYGSLHRCSKRFYRGRAQTHAKFLFLVVAARCSFFEGPLSTGIWQTVRTQQSASMTHHASCSQRCLPLPLHAAATYMHMYELYT